MRGKVIREPAHLGRGWTRFDFARAMRKPVRIVNDAAMQALGSYTDGTMLFLGFGTGLGSARPARHERVRRAGRRAPLAGLEQGRPRARFIQEAGTTLFTQRGFNASSVKDITEADAGRESPKGEALTMDFDPNEVRANRDFFAAKLRAYKEKAAVLKKVKDGLGHDFVLLDVRSRAAFRKAHVQGAWCTPYEELTALMPQLPRDLELVTYCWNDY